MNQWKVILQTCGITVEELLAAGASGRLTVAELDSFFVGGPQVEHMTLLLSLRLDASAVAESIERLARRAVAPPSA